MGYGFINIRNNKGSNVFTGSADLLISGTAAYRENDQAITAKFQLHYIYYGSNPTETIEDIRPDSATGDKIYLNDHRWIWAISSIPPKYYAFEAWATAQSGSTIVESQHLWLYPNTSLIDMEPGNISVNAMAAFNSRVLLMAQPPYTPVDPTLHPFLAVARKDVVLDPKTKAAGQSLIYNGTDWEASTMPISRKNLLLNPFFQVNQKGQSSYTGGTVATDMPIGFDGWICRDATHEKVFSIPHCIRVRKGSDAISGYLMQPIYDYKNLFGKTVTLSVHLHTVNLTGSANILLNMWTGTYRAAATTTIGKSIRITEPGYHSLTLTMPDSLPAGHDHLVFSLRIENAAQNDYFAIDAAKLEVGGTSTLEYDSPARYEDDLALCQTRMVCAARASAYGYVTNGQKDYYMFIPLPMPLAEKLTVTMAGYVARIYNGYSKRTGSAVTAPVSLSVYNKIPGTSGEIAIVDTVTTAVDTNNGIMTYFINDLVLDAYT